jgi:hypothetical protein
MDLVALTAVPASPDLVALAAIADAVDRAAAADEVMWLGARGSYRAARDLRRTALVEALGAGRTPEEIALRLGVRPDDVRRLATS